MIELHYWPTPHGWKISIMLEECGMPYRMVPVNIGRGEQFTPEFVALINQHHKMPAIVDDEPPSGRDPLTVTESGAILVYLAEKSGKFLPAEGVERLQVMQWLMWQIGGLGPMASQNGHFLQYATEDVPYAIDRYGKEVRRLYGVLDKQLAHTGQHVAGAAFSIADIAVLPWIRLHKAQQIDLADYPHVAHWSERVMQRPGVQRGLALGRELRAPVLSEEAREALFGTTPGLQAAARQR
ncbi:glutathione binding-like protein [Pseudorhodoferax sp. Leaf267]|uniref:glutathione binding-like protein n=1 Tax=Pseudorhodoferax sp. Leaf267 TaxID=1736316 RepID=UPI0006FA24A3|nr:glutathione binding-like protein [Pseudorhodoferax sp. Leaf267]KQP17683.1 glutathione S-transferase [Pseudorhodoferax sp. Leaf267]